MTAGQQRSVSIWEQGASACYHPIKDRYIPCAWVEKCAWCKAVRWLSDSNTYWPPSTPPR